MLPDVRVVTVPVVMDESDAVRHWHLAYTEARAELDALRKRVTDTELRGEDVDRLTAEVAEWRTAYETLRSDRERLADATPGGDARAATYAERLAVVGDENGRLRRELDDALAATAEWRERMVKREVNAEMAALDAQVARLTAERDEARKIVDRCMAALRRACPELSTRGGADTPGDLERGFYGYAAKATQLLKDLNRTQRELREALDGRQRDRDEYETAMGDHGARIRTISKAIEECDAVAADLVWRWRDVAARHAAVEPCPRCWGPMLRGEAACVDCCWGPMLRGEAACVDCAKDGAELLGSVGMR